MIFCLDHPKTLADFTYEDSDINEIVYECMGSLTFRGVAKEFAFSQNGDIEDSLIVERVQCNKFTIVHLISVAKQY